MTTPTAEGQPGAGPDRVERIRRRLIWALLLPFCVLTSVAAVEGFSSEDAGHPGIAITVSSGDNGYGVQFPASSPHVTAVGGTSLSHASNSRGWNDPMPPAMKIVLVRKRLPFDVST